MTFSAGDLIVWNTYPDEIPLAVLQVRDAPAYDLDVVIAGYLMPGDTTIKQVGFNTTMNGAQTDLYFKLYEPEEPSDYVFKLNDLISSPSGTYGFDMTMWAVTNIDINSGVYELTRWQGVLTSEKKTIFKETVESKYVLCQWQIEIWDFPYHMDDVVILTPESFDDFSKFVIVGFEYFSIGETSSFRIRARCTESVKGTHTVGTTYIFQIGNPIGTFDYSFLVLESGNGDGDDNQLKWIIPVAIAGAAGLILLMKGKK